MFDRLFFSSILPEHVRSSVAAHSGSVPVLELHLLDRTVLDLCHIVRLADSWIAVAYFCREDAPAERGIAFIPYATIARVELTMHDDAEREIGFETGVKPIETSSDASDAHLVVPTSGSTE
jgi:hypothetical protein